MNEEQREIRRKERVIEYAEYRLACKAAGTIRGVVGAVPICEE